MECLRLIQRSGNTASAEGSESHLRELFPMLGRRFKQVIVRGDSAFAKQTIFDACEEAGRGSSPQAPQAWTEPTSGTGAGASQTRSSAHESVDRRDRVPARSQLQTLSVDRAPGAQPQTVARAACTPDRDRALEMEALPTCLCLLRCSSHPHCATGPRSLRRQPPLGVPSIASRNPISRSDFLR
ncbi:MAG: hypothetical protein GY725_04235 [bacterium]|nr:hypothetical protein [bacterium]